MKQISLTNDPPKANDRLPAVPSNPRELFRGRRGRRPNDPSKKRSDSMESWQNAIGTFPAFSSNPTPEELQRLRAAFNLLTDVVLFVDPVTLRLTEVNQAACRSLGYSEQELTSMHLQEIAPDIDREALATSPDPSNPADGYRNLSTRHRHRNGSLVSVQWRLAAVETPLDRHLIVIAREVARGDVREGHGLGASTGYAASYAGYDPLTDLPDRRTFEKRLVQAIALARQEPGYAFGVLFVDLDNFKAINDTWGHLLGDCVLCQVAERLSRCVRPGDLVARLGGDEFTVLIDHLQHVEDALVVAERVRSHMQTPMVIESRQLNVTASIGIALSAPSHSQPRDILGDADWAMYRAKAMGRNCHVLFAAESGWRPGQPR